MECWAPYRWRHRFWAVWAGGEGEVTRRVTHRVSKSTSGQRAHVGGVEKSSFWAWRRTRRGGGLGGVGDGGGGRRDSVVVGLMRVAPILTRKIVTVVDGTRVARRKLLCISRQCAL